MTRVRRLCGLRSRLGEAGASGVEYALLLGFIAMIAVSAVTMVGGPTNDAARALGGTPDRSEAPALAGPPSTLGPTATCAGNSGSARRSTNSNGRNCQVPSAAGSHP